MATATGSSTGASPASHTIVPGTMQSASAVQGQTAQGSTTPQGQTAPVMNPSGQGTAAGPTTASPPTYAGLNAFGYYPPPPSRVSVTKLYWNKVSSFLERYKVFASSAAVIGFVLTVVTFYFDASDAADGPRQEAFNSWDAQRKFKSACWFDKDHGIPLAPDCLLVMFNGTVLPPPQRLKEAFEHVGSDTLSFDSPSFTNLLTALILHANAQDDASIRLLELARMLEYDLTRRAHIISLTLDYASGVSATYDSLRRIFRWAALWHLVNQSALAARVRGYFTNPQSRYVRDVVYAGDTRRPLQPKPRDSGAGIAGKLMALILRASFPTMGWYLYLYGLSLPTEDLMHLRLPFPLLLALVRIIDQDIRDKPDDGSSLQRFLRLLPWTTDAAMFGCLCWVF